MGLMKRYGIVAGILSVALLGPGCATRRQVKELKMEIQAVRTDLAGVRSENARLDSLFRSNIDQSRKLNADFAAYVARLDERMQMVEARLEDAITLINRASGAIESRSGLPARTTDSTGADTSAVSGHVDCQKIYNAAYFDVVKQEYDLAISGFENYLKECSGTALADNAQYWIGECYYLEKKYELAEKAFQNMIDNYPTSERQASAKLKLAKSMYNQRFKTKAKGIFESIVREYPGTQEAGEAAEMLERYR
jgi:tol-pal system protein YbgF